MNTQNNKKFLALSYHYVRAPEANKRFPRILGNTVVNFISQVKLLKETYEIISPEEAEGLYYPNGSPFKQDRVSLLFTFDDGLSDQYLVAQILNNLGIKAFFFIPTCILTDGLPANPIIIHYCLAKYGIKSFLNTFNEAANRHGVNIAMPVFTKGADVWKTIAEVKKKINYELGPHESRKILTDVYKNSFLHEYPNALEIMHLTEIQIKNIIQMGHSIGSHSHSHVSIASYKLTDMQIEKELIMPRRTLETRFGTRVIAMSYPFGESMNCLSATKLRQITQDYRLVFSIEKKMNTAATSPLELGRYMPTANDTAESICETLAGIVQKNRD